MKTIKGEEHPSSHTQFREQMPTSSLELATGVGVSLQAELRSRGLRVWSDPPKCPHSLESGLVFISSSHRGPAGRLAVLVQKRKLYLDPLGPVSHVCICCLEKRQKLPGNNVCSKVPSVCADQDISQRTQVTQQGKRRRIEGRKGGWVGTLNRNSADPMGCASLKKQTHVRLSRQTLKI